MIIEMTPLTSEDPVEDILEHFGIKGMRWGVRNKTRSVIDRAKQARADDVWERKISSKKSVRSIVEKATAKSKSADVLKDFDNLPERHWDMETVKKYNAARAKDINRHINNSLKDVSSPSGRRKLLVEVIEKNGRQQIRSRTLATNRKGKTRNRMTAANQRKRIYQIQATRLGIGIVGTTLLALAHDDMDTADDILEHFGIKGMQWGVHRARRAYKKEVGVKDYKWEKKNSKDYNKVIDIYNAGLRSAQKDLHKINEKWRDSGEDLHKDPAKTTYLNELTDKMNQHLRTVSSSHISPSGKRELRVVVDETGGLFLSSFPIEHASDNIRIKLVVEKDKNGLITNISLPSMAQSDMIVDDFLEHFGVKGMRWGVRNKRKDTLRSLQTNADATGTNVSVGKERTRFKKSPKRLTSVELADRIKRMEMEKRYNDLNKRDISQGRAATTQILSGVGKTLATKTLMAFGMYTLKKALPPGVAQELGGKGGKGAAKAAAKAKQAWDASGKPDAPAGPAPSGKKKKNKKKKKLGDMKVPAGPAPKMDSPWVNKGHIPTAPLPPADSLRKVDWYRSS